MSTFSSTQKSIELIPQERVPMPVQTPAERVNNFNEVALGYSQSAALVEADRCLLCTTPTCVPACPVHIDIPGFIQKLAEQDVQGAYSVLREANILTAICGRICAQEQHCEGACIVGETLEPVAIGRLERWVGDQAIELGWSASPKIAPNGHKVGIIGSGPAGIACAADLAKAGCEVTIYEAFHKPGGVLRYGIPEFRLPDSVITAEINHLLQLGVKIECSTLVGRLFTIEQMIEELGFAAVFIATGAGTPLFMNLPGELLNGVLSATELLTRCNQLHGGVAPYQDAPLGLGKQVAVIGSGNTAMDAMRIALRLGAEKVYCIYRRSLAESFARSEELTHAEEEGAVFHWLTNPIEILDDGNGNVCGLKCVRMAFGEPDESGRRSTLPIEGSEFTLDASTVVYAIGTSANPIIGQTSKLKLKPSGYIETDRQLATSLAGVYAGGDIVTGDTTVIQAMGEGRKAAQSIKDYLGINSC